MYSPHKTNIVDKYFTKAILVLALALRQIALIIVKKIGMRFWYVIASLWQILINISIWLLRKEVCLLHRT